MKKKNASPTFSQYSYIFLCLGPIYSTFITPNFVAKVPVTFAGPAFPEPALSFWMESFCSFKSQKTL